MLIKITAGRGVGQIVDMIPAVAKARIAGGTAIAVQNPDDSSRLDSTSRETAALEPHAKRGAKPARKKAARAR